MGFSLVAVSRGCSLVAVLRLVIMVASLVVEHRLWGMPAPVVVTCGLSSCGFQALEPRLDSCGSWAYLLQGTWDLPRSGVEPVSPALVGRPPSKHFLRQISYHTSSWEYKVQYFRQLNYSFAC